MFIELTTGLSCRSILVNLGNVNSFSAHSKGVSSVVKYSDTSDPIIVNQSLDYIQNILSNSGNVLNAN